MASAAKDICVRVVEEGEKLDRVVARAAGVSRRVARTLIASGRVTVDGKPVRILTRPVARGSEVCVRADPASVSRKAVPAPLAVLYSDRYIVVVNKPAGLLSEHDRFGSPSLESVVPAWLRQHGESERLWLVHRLDAGTSGVLVMTRTPMATHRLGDAFRRGEVRKEYLALCVGRFVGEQVVDAPIARAERTRHAVAQAGKPARTHLTSLSTTGGAALVLAEPRTGRTHQIRVHLAHLGHPLFGDRLYGGPMYTEGAAPLAVPRPMLHAARLHFAHPKSGKQLTFVAPVPSDFAELCKDLGLDEENLGVYG